MNSATAPGRAQGDGATRSTASKVAAAEVGAKRSGAADRLVQALSTGSAGLAESIEEDLAWIRSVEPDIRAFAALDEDRVRGRVDELARCYHRGMLFGVPVGVKDVIDTAALRTEYGSALFAGHRPSDDAWVVERLEAQGALVMGKTVTTEFAMFHPGPTRNPWDAARTPGGSSSGSAAAVACGMVPVALGTQTAGSVIRPAAFCGVYGFKPCFGWASTRGVWRLAPNLDTLGIFAREVADLALVYRALTARPSSAGKRVGEQHRHARRQPSVAVLWGEEWARADADVRGAVDDLAGRMGNAGWTVRELALPEPFVALPEAHETVMTAEVAYELGQALGERVEQVSEETRCVVDAGRAVSAQRYLKAQAARTAASEALQALGAVFDVVLTPSTLGVAPEGLAHTGDPIMCRAWTLLGVPAANMPWGQAPGGLPVGVQVVGLGSDDELLEHLALIEQLGGKAR